MKLILERFAYTPMGTFGRLSGLDIFTLEEPWRNNQRQISCIPEGRYRCKRIMSPKFGNVFEITNVSGRSHILIHKGNTIDDVEGCVLVGNKLGVLGDRWAVLESRGAFDKFMAFVREDSEFDLLITFNSGYDWKEAA